ncbi:MAG TPA: DNA recombination protein RmuC [Mycobacteriales bacterium]|nr:DNA recombination protein RmuC [Mycobacteriales bacterium]
MDVFALVLLAVGLLLGALIGALVVRARAAATVAAAHAERRAALDRLALTEQHGEKLREQFRALSAEALERNSHHLVELADARLRTSSVQASGELEQRRQAIEHLVAPLRETLGRVETQLRELEHTRTAAHATLLQQVEFVRATGEQVRRETAALVTALRKPQTRGRWGELQLRRVVEVAGMVERCDFDAQSVVAGDDGAQRPDLVVHLAGGKHVVVDAKVPLSAFLEAAETTDDEVRAERLAAHARQLRQHVDTLAGKAYWQRFTPTPEFVVLFVPGEAFLAQALDTDPALLEHAATRRVVLATPTTLIALLRTVAYAWSQDALARNAQQVHALGRELYERLGTLGGHVDRLGRAIGGAVNAFNATVGSLESRVLVTARRLRDLDVVDSDLGTVPQVDSIPRVLAAEELVGDARAVVPLPSPGAFPTEADVDRAAESARRHG